MSIQERISQHLIEREARRKKQAEDAQRQMKEEAEFLERFRDLRKNTIIPVVSETALALRSKGTSAGWTEEEGAIEGPNALERTPIVKFFVNGRQIPLADLQDDRTPGTQFVYFEGEKRTKTIKVIASTVLVPTYQNFVTTTIDPATLTKAQVEEHLMAIIKIAVN